MNEKWIDRATREDREVVAVRGPILMAPEFRAAVARSWAKA